MLYFVTQYLRTFAGFSLCFLLFACATSQEVPDRLSTATVIDRDEQWCAPDEGHQACFPASRDSIVCPADNNVVQCFFFDSVLQIETKRQIRDLVSALKDALELPIEELRKPRYANSSGELNKLTADQIIGSYYCCGTLMRGWGRILSSTQGFYLALKFPENVPLLKQKLKEAEEALPYGLDDDFPKQGE